MVLVLLYAALGYWAAGVCVFEGKTVVYSGFGTLFMEKMVLGFIGGWILIPLAIIKRLLFRR